MAQHFDAKAEARLLTKLLKMADSASTTAGGSILAQRLIDYASDELCTLTSEQKLQVLSLIDKNLPKNLIKDGYGNVHGYVHSSEIYVSLKCRTESRESFIPPASRQPAASAPAKPTRTSSKSLKPPRRISRAK